MALWGEYDGWKYDFFDLNEPASSFGHFEDVVSLWLSKCKGKDMPSWSDFDFYDFKGWHGKICVTEVTLDPFDFRYRLFGTDYVDLFKEDYTNKSARDTFTNTIHSEKEMEFFEFTAKNKKIGKSSGLIPWKNIHNKRASFLDLPLSENSHTVTHTVEFLQIDEST